MARPLDGLHSWQRTSKASDGGDDGEEEGRPPGAGGNPLLDPLGGGGAPAPAWQQRKSQYVSARRLPALARASALHRSFHQGIGGRPLEGAPAGQRQTPRLRLGHAAAFAAAAVLPLPLMCPQLHQQALSLTLHPGEAVSEVLSVTPLAAGWLRITGVAWMLNDAVEGFAPFEPKGRKRKHPKGPRSALGAGRGWHAASSGRAKRPRQRRRPCLACCAKRDGGAQARLNCSVVAMAPQAEPAEALPSLAAPAAARGAGHVPPAARHRHPAHLHVHGRGEALTTQ